VLQQCCWRSWADFGRNAASDYSWLSVSIRWHCCLSPVFSGLGGLAWA
jgi:hypothetical protein